MRNPFLLILFVSFGLSAQQVSIQIEWNMPQTDYINGQSFTYLNFEGAVYDEEGFEVPKYCLNTSIPNWNIQNIRLANVEVANLTSQESRIIVKDKLPTEFKIYGGVSGKDKAPYLTSCIASLRLNPTTNQVEKLVSADLLWDLGVLESSRKTNNFTTESVLNTGKWYKMSVANNGIYKITPNFLSDAGMGSNHSISGIGVFGNGMGELPERNDGFRYDDLMETAIFVNDANADGVFNGSDYILFYGRGPKPWSYNPDGNEYQHHNNHYTDVNYYFITTDRGSGKRIGNVSYNPGSPTHTITSFDDYQFNEVDRVNLLGTGRRWFGDLFDFQLSYNYNFSFPNRDVSSPVKVNTRAVARSSEFGTNLQVREGGVTRSSMVFNSIVNAGYVDEKASSAEFTTAANNVVLNLFYNNSINPAAIAWLDYIEVIVRRNLVKAGAATFFRDAESLGSGNVAEYQVSGMGSNDVIWDLTDHLFPKYVSFSLQNNTAIFKAPADSLREFVVVSGSSFPEPSKVGAVANQNLHGISPSEFVIVAHPSFISQAERLAQYHRDVDGYNVVVVDVNHIYNEFNSGAQDITAIKDFMRSLYEKASTPEETPRYLLLFGDASYDYKNRINPNHNFVPIFESNASFSFNSSFSTDDYFGYLDPSEGSGFPVNSLDLSIGRFPVSSAAQAKVAVDKVIHYSTMSSSFGNWRNDVLLVTDDVDVLWERTLTTVPETKIKQMEAQEYPMFNYQKIYSDAYVQTSSAGSQRYPEARQELFRKVNAGNLMTVYVGHGGEVGWATERILQLDDINGWSNIDNMPVFVTITCEFSRLDDPKRISAGEQLFRNPDGAGVALFSTTRSVGAQPALRLNNLFLDTVFARVDGEYQKMGDVIRTTKNQSSDFDRVKFSLLGDPALQMAIPEYRVVNTSLNNDPMGIANDTLKALSQVKIEGEVRDMTGALMTDFNGTVFPKIFDKQVDKQTLTNDGIGDPVNYKLFENIIFSGAASVDQGKFAYEFIVPLDISYNIGFGKINSYTENKEIDANGSYTQVLVGGLNVNASIDAKGPDIDLFINDRSFVSGGITNSNPVLYVEVFDSSGINTVGNGIGHDIIAVLDGNSNNTFVLNDYYEADLNSFRSGKIQYPLQSLEPGEHKLLFRVWDVYNNPSETEITFVVTESSELEISRVLNWPNPFTTYTEFQFEHNRASEPLDVQVQIFSVSGQIIKTINQRIQSTGNRVSGISWDGLDEYGDQIAKGVYVYKLKVKSAIDNAYTEKLEKLVILR